MENAYITTIGKLTASDLENIQTPVEIMVEQIFNRANGMDNSPVLAQPEEVIRLWQFHHIGG